MQIKEVYFWNTQVYGYNPWPTAVTNYIPQMVSNSQNGYIATSSEQFESRPAYDAFYVETVSWSNEKQFHSTKIYAGNTARSQIQCPDNITVTKIKIASRKADTSINQRPIRAFTLQWSNDWTNFTDLLTQTNLASTRWNYSTSNEQERTVTTNTAYQYYKLVVTANGDYVAFNYWNIDGLI